MIRDYNKDDIDAIIELMDKQHTLLEREKDEERKELQGDKKVLVYDDGRVKGICTMSFWQNLELRNCCKIIMSVEDARSLKEIADALWKNVQPILIEKDIALLMTNYNETHKRWNEFFEEKKFKDWFGVRDMQYKGGSYEKTKLNFRPYEDEDFEIYYSALGEAFSVMREANDIKPFNVFTGQPSEKIEKLKKETLENKENIYMFYDKDIFIGSSIVKDNGVDDVFVVPVYQGQGYGRKIMEAALNLAFEKDFSAIWLGVVVWNVKAFNLYKSLGFKVYDTFKFQRLVLKK
jgi:RimJ/RimL family protein N-acetyltransferase